MKNKTKGLARLLSAFGYSIQGLKSTYKTEAAFREELTLVIVAVPLAFFIGSTAFEIAILIASVLLLLVVELLNTAIENVVDRIGDEYHDLSAAAKDSGSAAVLLTSVLAVVVWFGVIFTY